MDIYIYIYNREREGGREGGRERERGREGGSERETYTSTSIYMCAYVCIK